MKADKAGQSQRKQSLFFNKILNISCNVSNSVLKMRNRMVLWVLSVLVVNPHDSVADWELWRLPLPSNTQEHIASQGKDQNSKKSFY